MLRKSVVCFSLLAVLTAATPAFSATPTYTISSGDTLWVISERTHVSVAKIVRLNHLRNPNFLRLGQVLRLVGTPTKSERHVTRHAGTKTVAAKIKRTHSRVRVSGQARLAESQALWVATHTGNTPNPSAIRSFTVAERVLALELQLTRTALRYLGVPYAWGGESFGGVDCSGFVQAVFRHNGIQLPRTADAQFEVGQRISHAMLLPGDLVFFATYAAGASHVGIYLGGGRFVHASASNGVRVDSLSDDYYSTRYLGARREVI